MHNLRHFYYQNKEKIWKVVLIIAFLLGIIYFLNNLVSKDNNTNNAVETNKTEGYSNEQTQTYISDKSAISGETVTESEVKKINNTISKFLQYCKNGNAEEAYNMLSEDCKENEFSTLEKFKERYLQSKFTQNDVYEIESWIDDTYKISISEDLLITGNANSSKKIEYITIVEENNEEKLNINGYIGKKEINKEITKNNVKITATSKRTYMDYEIYDFKIENLSNKTIKLDSLEKTGTMYLEDTAGNRYNAYAHELLEDEIEINSKRRLNISIKYANTYSYKTTISKITFKNIILDYIKYKTTEDTKEFEDICELTINL